MKPVLVRYEQKLSVDSDNIFIIGSVIFSDDHARVILGKIDSCPGSDYINASYIDVSR